MLFYHQINFTHSIDYEYNLQRLFKNLYIKLCLLVDVYEYYTHDSLIDILCTYN